MDAVKTEALTKYYGKSRGILEMDLSVAEGDFFGLIGPNGAGKSTMIRILLGLIVPSRGSAQIFGVDVARNKREVLSQVGYMPSEASFYRNMRVKEVLRFSAGLRGLDCGKEADRLCERLELSPGRKIRELSLGNRKKVSIVCALQHHPRLCVLDEPTSGLDPLMQREFYQILQERNREGATIFLSSHVLTEIQRYCKHAAVIREGKLLAVDSVSRLGHTGAKRVILRGNVEVPVLIQEIREAMALERDAGKVPMMFQGIKEAMALERDAGKVPELSWGVGETMLPDGVRDLKKDGDTVQFLYSGSLKVLLDVLGRFPLEDLTIQEPDLEEVFLHFYEKDIHRA